MMWLMKCVWRSVLSSAVVVVVVVVGKEEDDTLARAENAKTNGGKCLPEIPSCTFSGASRRWRGRQRRCWSPLSSQKGRKKEREKSQHQVIKDANNDTAPRCHWRPTWKIMATPISTFAFHYSLTALPENTNFSLRFSDVIILKYLGATRLWSFLD